MDALKHYFGALWKESINRLVDHSARQKQKKEQPAAPVRRPERRPKLEFSPSLQRWIIREERPRLYLVARDGEILPPPQDLAA